MRVDLRELKDNLREHGFRHVKYIARDCLEEEHVVERGGVLSVLPIRKPFDGWYEQDVEDHADRVDKGQRTGLVMEYAALVSAVRSVMPGTILRHYSYASSGGSGQHVYAHVGLPERDGRRYSHAMQCHIPASRDAAGRAATRLRDLLDKAHMAADVQYARVAMTPQLVDLCAIHVLARRLRDPDAVVAALALRPETPEIRRLHLDLDADEERFEISAPRAQRGVAGHPGIMVVARAGLTTANINGGPIAWTGSVARIKGVELAETILDSLHGRRLGDIVDADDTRGDLTIRSARMGAAKGAYRRLRIQVESRGVPLGEVRGVAMAAMEHA